MDEEILEMIVEMAVSEVMHCILATKCCRWSKKKWVKIMNEVKNQKEDRADRINTKIKSQTPIKNFAQRISTI